MHGRAEFMERAIELARKGMRAGDGGPFGALVVREGKVLGEGWNRVIADKDPTAHGEVVAIRAACRQLGDFRLDGGEIYTTGQPCPMCLGAIHWARISRIYYGFRIEDAAGVGFDDAAFFDEFTRPERERSIPATALLAAESRRLLDEYAALGDRTRY